MTASRSVISDEEKISRLKEDCRYPVLSFDPVVQKLFLMEKITLEELNRVNPAEINTVLKLLQSRSVQQRLIDRDWTLGDVKEANGFPQIKILPNLATFCEKHNDDISWEVDATGIKTTISSPENKRVTEKRFSPALIKLLKESQGGCCSGLTSMFLARAYLTTLRAEAKTTEIKPLDNLRKFYRDLKAIASWDGSSALSLEEQALFRAFLYQMLQFHNAAELALLNVPQGAWDKMLLLSVQPDFPFMREEVYTMTVTEEQLREKLSLLNQPGRLTYISSGSHTIGRFNNLFFDSNNFAGDIQHQSAGDLANLIFKTLKFKNSEEAHLIHIAQFRHRLAPVAIYLPHEEMLENCSNPTVRTKLNQTGLLLASRENDLKSLKVYLPKLNCDVNAVDMRGWNALMLACRSGHAEVVRILLQEREDCDVNAVDKHGWSALMFAALYNYPDAIRVMLQKRKDCAVNVVDGAGMSSLMMAAYYNHTDVVRALLQESKDCDVTIADNVQGRNVLMLASSLGHIDVVRVLLQERKGLDLNAVDKNSISALVLAVDNKHMKIARLLIAHGAAIVLPRLSFSGITQASFDELRKQKELNLADPVIRDCITKGLLSESEASVLSPIEREQLQDKTLLDKTLQHVLTEKMLTMEQLLELTPLEISALKIANNTLALFPADEGRVIKHESAEDYLRNTFSQLKTHLNRWVEEERKGESDSSGRWLTSMQAILNIDMQNALLSAVCENLKTQYINQIFLEMNFLLNSIQSSVPKIKSLSFFPNFSKSPENYLIELNNVINSKMTPAAKLHQIRKSLDFASKKFPNVKLFTEMAAALNDYPYFKIFVRKKEMEESKEQSVRFTG